MSTPPMPDEFPPDEEQSKQLVKAEPAVDYPLARVSDDLEILNGDSEENLYAGISTAIVTLEQEAILRRPIDISIVEINPMGEVYVPHAEYRKTLCDAFHPGGWGIRPIGKPTLYGNWLMQWYSLYVGGKYISSVPAEAQYFPDNPRMVYATALESLRSVALRRLCKDLGMFLECWDKAFIFKFKSENCVRVEYLDNKGKVVRGWRRKDSPRMDGEEEYAQVVARRKGAVKQTLAEASAKQSPANMVAEESGQKAPSVVETQPAIEMIDIDLGNGKQKAMPRGEIIGVKVANSTWFKKQFLSHKHFLDKNENPVRRHFDNHLLAHFGIHSPVNLTWEMLVAMQRHLDGKGDDPKYYSPAPTSPPPDSDKQKEKREDGEEDTGAESKMLAKRVANAGLSTLVAQWQQDYHLPAEIEANQDFVDMLNIVLEGVEKGHFRTDTAEGLAEIDKEFRASFISEVPL